MEAFDAIIIGSGHNGLICGSYLARAGMKVLVVERNQRVGGGLLTEQATLPGFQHNLHANFIMGLELTPAKEAVVAAADDDRIKRRPVTCIIRRVDPIGIRLSRRKSLGGV